MKRVLTDQEFKRWERAVLWVPITALLLFDVLPFLLS